jgi:hypothetical protein
MRHIPVVLGLALLLLARGAASADDAKPAAPAKPVDVPGFWTEDELRRIDQGLEVLNLTRKDLGFQKRPIDDPFRLPVVNQILDDPLSIGPVAAEWDAVARTGDPVALLARANAALATGPADATTDLHLHAAEVDERLGGEAAAQVDLTLVAIARAQTLVRRARSGAFDGKNHYAFLRKAVQSQRADDAERKPEPGDITDEEFLKEVQLVDQSAMRAAGAIAAKATADLVAALKARMLYEGIGIFGEVRSTTAIGDVVLYGMGADVHPRSRDANDVLEIDLGGDDVWELGASVTPQTAREVQIVIDLAGNDSYIGENDFSFGGALGGVAIQWDCAGNDTYRGGNCSCGAGILGVGVLVDEGGNDVYRCKDFCEGAGAFGIGLLLEKGGNDIYHADLYGQGYGSTWGCGMLVELAGNDVYDAGGAHVDEPLWRDRYTSLSQGFGFGMRPDASGGVGVLVDVSGNDRYSCDIFGQGCSYWFSLGLLIDDDGHDTYACGQYGQGSGIHLSCGMLLDRHGQDNYYDANGVGMGGAHDYAVGFLVDREGDDYYSGGGCAQGSGHTNSVGMLIDDAGDDGYSTVRGITQGSASWTRNTGGIGLLLDGAGHDSYSETTRDAGVAVRDTIGACIDEPTPEAVPSANPMNAAISKDDAEKKVVADGQTDGKWDLDKLWKIVSAWEVGDNTVIIPIAKEKFVALGKPALDRAFENFDDKHGLAIRAVEYTVAEFAKSDRAGVIARLLEKTKDKDKLVRKNAVLIVTNLKVEEALPRLVEMLTTDADTTGTVLAALASMKTAPPEVVALLKAPKEPVGVQAAVCLAAAAQAADGDSVGPYVDPLLNALEPDYAFPVRLAAQERLASLGSRALTRLACWNDAPTRMGRRARLRALGATKQALAAATIPTAFADADPMIRLSGMLAAQDLIPTIPNPESDLLAAALAKARESETDPLVRRLVLPPVKALAPPAAK